MAFLLILVPHPPKAAFWCSSIFDLKTKNSPENEAPVAKFAMRTTAKFPSAAFNIYPAMLVINVPVVITVGAIEMRFRIFSQCSYLSAAAQYGHQARQLVLFPYNHLYSIMSLMEVRIWFFSSSVNP